MLSSPELPTHVRATILMYVEEKLAGLYGHNKAQLSRFKAGLSSPNRGHLFGSSWWPAFPSPMRLEAEPTDGASLHGRATNLQNRRKASWPSLTTAVQTVVESLV